ncbi:MAG: HAMP domain-containing histidine kinase [Alphaproteobacteria bacterium]|nr:HAMP domain-containing histidine kinase [Alphaproteobacteria bacterium]
MTDKAASQTLAGEAALQVARSFALQLETVIAPIVSKRFSELEASLSAADDYVGHLRRSTHERSPPFVALYENGQRLYPPVGDSALLFQERQYLVEIGPALKSALASSPGDNQPNIWVRVLGETHLLSCRRVGTSRILCIATTGDEFHSAIRNVFSGAMPVAGQTAELIDPWGNRHWPAEISEVIKGPAVHLDLAGVMAGWQMRVGINTTAGSIAPLITAIVIPVMIGWGLALIALFRYQAEVSRQHRLRAENAARLSHDLRTPIANLGLYVDLISRHEKENPSVVRCCSALEEEIERLAVIADNTVRHSRGLAMRVANGPLAAADQVIGGLLSRYEPLMAQSGCSLSFYGGAPTAMIKDRSGLERILVNLIDNARSHACGANVEVSTRPSPDGLVLVIVDDGARAASATQVCGGGYGLGLKVVQELAQSQGGTFKAVIGAEGSRFEVALPCEGVRAV